MKVSEAKACSMAHLRIISSASCRGLANSNGAVWYSSQASYSLRYNTKDYGNGLLTGPKNSIFKRKTVLFGVEAVRGGRVLTDGDVINQADQSTTALRCAFVGPEDRLDYIADQPFVPIG